MNAHRAAMFCTSAALRRVVLCGVFASAPIVLLSDRTTAQGHQIAPGLPRLAQLDEASLRKAVVFGETSRPEPYLLYPNPGPRDEATMAVYTPFIRVALAAHAARQRGERLDASTLPLWVVERDIHVVVRPADRSASMARLLFPADPPLAETPITQIGLQRHGRLHFLDFIPPRWMTTDLSYLTLLGGLPFPDAVAAAAFDPDLLVKDVDVYGWWQKQNEFFPSHGFLNPDDIKSWR
jgi:hypothetical protein